MAERKDVVVREGDDDEVVDPQSEGDPGWSPAIYPENDGEGGIKFVEGGPDTAAKNGGEAPEASYEDWAAQNEGGPTSGVPNQDYSDSDDPTVNPELNRGE